VFEASTKVANASAVKPFEIYPGREQLGALGQLLKNARQPIAIVGGSGWSSAAVQQLVHFAERFALPVAVGFRRQMLFPANHASFVGDLGIGANPRLVARIKTSDLVLAIGTRLSEAATQGYTLFNIPNPATTLVHVHADPSELGRVYRASLAINATPTAFADALKDLDPPAELAWSRLTQEARAEYLVWSDPSVITAPGNLQVAKVMQYLIDRLPEDAVICNGAGNYAIWIHRFFRFRQFGTQLAPTSGSMGYGVPAGVAAKTLFSDRAVVVFAGDGCFLMNGQEFATAVQYKLPIIVILIDTACTEPFACIRSAAIQAVCMELI